MKYIQIILLVLVMFFSCDERTPNPGTVVIPEWLKPRLTELESVGDCNGCTVQRYTYNNEYFYHVNCTFSSCFDCEVYYYNGNPVDWEFTDRADYETNRTRVTLIWECGDDLELE